MSEKPLPVVIHVANPQAFAGRGSVILLELADEVTARKVARKIADETGRRVTVRYADMILIEAIPPAKIH
jgi:hypothetical protein